MEGRLYKAGEKLSGIKTVDDAKILICYLLSVIKESLMYSDLVEVLTECEFVNYFDLLGILDDLESSGQIEKDEKDKLRITENGRNNVGRIENLVPYSAKELAVETTLKLLDKQRKEKSNRVTVEEIEDGYVVKIDVLDIGSDLMNLKFWVPDKMCAKGVKERLRRNPELAYKGVLALLTGDNEMLLELAKVEQEKD